LGSLARGEFGDDQLYLIIGVQSSTASSTYPLCEAIVRSGLAYFALLTKSCHAPLNLEMKSTTLGSIMIKLEGVTYM
jgi:hypothetical protein